MAIEIQEVIKIVESYKKYASDETVGTIESIIREVELFVDEYSEGQVKQYGDKL